MSHTFLAPTYDLAVFIGRFQIYHEMHASIVRRALQTAKCVCVLVGSANAARSYRNPFTWQERARMILDSLPAKDAPRVIALPLEDSPYNETAWIAAAQAAVEKARAIAAERLPGCQGLPRTTLIGHSKDHTSYYLSLFPQWDFVNVEHQRDLDSTYLRGIYFSNAGEAWLKNCDGHKPGDLPQDRIVPGGAKDFLEEFAKTPEYKWVVEEYEFVARYRRDFAGLPYPPKFVTVDAVVIQSGHVLMVRRKERPGRGLWALPGGHLNNDETIEDGVFRELDEETKIAVPPAVLRGSVAARQVFDDPHRSSRGRTITHAYLIRLKPSKQKGGKKHPFPLPEIRACSDAAAAEWIPLAGLRRDQTFEDHYDIVQTLAAA